MVDFLVLKQKSTNGRHNARQIARQKLTQSNTY